MKTDFTLIKSVNKLSDVHNIYLYNEQGELEEDLGLEETVTYEALFDKLKMEIDGSIMKNSFKENITRRTINLNIEPDDYMKEFNQTGYIMACHERNVIENFNADFQSVYLKYLKSIISIFNEWFNKKGINPPEIKNNTKHYNNSDYESINNELSNAHSLIKKEREEKKKLIKVNRKLRANANKPTIQEVERVANNTRKKSGKLNYLAMSKELNCSDHTAKKYCKEYNIK